MSATGGGWAVRGEAADAGGGMGAGKHAKYARKALRAEG
jgi:hypothetical protein